MVKYLKNNVHIRYSNSHILYLHQPLIDYCMENSLSDNTPNIYLSRKREYLLLFFITS